MAEAPISFAIGRQSALAEAYGLYRMIQPECSVGELRELIAVPPRIERVLRAYAKAHVEDAHWIETYLKFRQAVAEEFERRLCARGGAMDLPEVDDGELDPVEQGSAARIKPQLSNPERTSRQNQLGMVSHDSADERGRVRNHSLVGE